MEESIIDNEKQRRKEMKKNMRGDLLVLSSIHSEWRC